MLFIVVVLSLSLGGAGLIFPFSTCLMAAIIKKNFIVVVLS